MHFKEFAVVDDAPDDGLHVDRFGRVGRDQVVDALIRNAFDRHGEVVRGVFRVVRRQEGQEVLDEGDGVLVVFGDEVGVAADRGVHFGAADLGHGRGAAGDGLDDFGAGEEHLRVLARHDDEVHQRGRVGGTAGAGAADDGDLGDDAGEEHVGVEDVAVAGEGVDAFLDTGAAGVLEGDDGDADLDRVAHDAGDLARLHLAEAAGLDAEVLAESGDLFVAEVAGTGDDAVGGEFLAFHAEVHGVVFGVHADFLEGACVKQGVDALARRQNPLGVHRFELLGLDVVDDLLAPPAQEV